jgi:uncharacterized protein DUF6636
MRRASILTGLAICALLAACGSDTERASTPTVVQKVVDPDDSPASPEATPTVSRTDRTATIPRGSTRKLAHFRTPSSNIGCVLVGNTARCDIDKRNWKPPPKPVNCPGDWGQGVEVSHGNRARVVCAGDTTLDPKGPVLEYGQHSRSGGFDCQSSAQGVTCRDLASGSGFFLSKAGYHVF